jgi:hypothetical protein
MTRGETSRTDNLGVIAPSEFSREQAIAESLDRGKEYKLKMRSEGRYTVADVREVLKENNALNFESLISELKKAILDQDKRIRVFDAGGNKLARSENEYMQKLKSRNALQMISLEIEEVRFDDLNSLLEKSYPEISFRFPMPESAVLEPAAGTDYSLLATPKQLIDAFGQYGLDEGLFKNVTNSKWLLNARKVKGVGKKGCEITPMFCPYEVMKNALKSARKVKGRMSERQGWMALRRHFPKVYEPYASYSGLD